MRAVRQGLSAVIIMCSLGCGGSFPAERPEESTSRDWVTVAWDTVWQIGGSADTLLLMPLSVIASDQRVYILDGGAKRVVALRASDGALAWIAGGPGAGPQEFLAPTAIALSASGDVLVADHRTARISYVDSLGKVIRHIRVPQVTYVQSMCPLADGGVVLTTLEQEAPIAHLGADGSLVQRLEFPWPELGNVHAIARQAFFASTDDHQACVLTLAFGRGFALYRDRQFSLTSDYVEPIAVPKVSTTIRETREGKSSSARIDRRIVGATDATVYSDTLIVSFEGRSSAAGKIIDQYDLRTGAYLKTYTFDRLVMALARSGDKYLFLHYAAGYPTLVAVVPELPSRK